MATRATKKKPAATSRSKTKSKPAARKARPAAARKPAAAINPAISQQSAELYQMPSFNAEQIDEATRQASETLRSAAESMMQTSNEVMQQFLASATSSDQAPEQDATDMANKAFAYSRDSMEQLTQMAGISSSAAQDSTDMLRENIDAFMASMNIFTQMTKQLVAHSVAFSNGSFNQQVEFSKQALTCRTLNDVFDLSNNYIKATTENIFTEMLAISELLFQGANEVSDPIQTQFNDTAERACKIMEV